MNKGSIVSEETRQKMRLAQQKRMLEGRHNFYKGREVSLEMREKISKSTTGLKVPSRYTPERNKKVGDAHRGKKRTPEQIENLRLAHLGKKQSKETIAKRFATRKGYRHSVETRLKISLSQKRGPEHPNWKGGISPLNKIIRRSINFKLWREAVFKRDNYTCVLCKKRGGELHPDHIKRFSDYPELRFEISNGRTLCVPCHRKTDTWGAKRKTNI